MKVKNLFAMAALALGFAACSSNDEILDKGTEAKLNTHVGLSLQFPVSSTKALPGDYNELAEDWKGRDKIETVTVFLVNKTEDRVDYTTFPADQLGVNQEGTLSEKLVVKSLPGTDVEVFVVVNDKNSIVSDLKKVSSSQFATVFGQKVVAATADKVATTKDSKDVILMTNTQLAKLEVKKGVTEEAARAGGNNVTVSVDRVVSRAILTMIDGDIIVKGKVVDEEKDLVKITEVTYVVGQSNKEFFLMQQPNFVTPEAAYNFVPTGGNWFNNTFLDYTSVTKNTEVQKVDKNDPTSLLAALVKETDSKFVLPVTHKESDYRKGNSTYFEITAKFVPTEVLEDTKEAYVPGESLFMGVFDKKFYSTKEAAVAKGQKVLDYSGGEMKYIIWLNPDNIKKPKMSPTVRNQVYHAHITGFKEMGLPNNPLNPEDPKNPDPKDPEDPDTPTNPIDPEDPLKTDDTYLSVSISVLNWGMHSYEVDLGNDY